MKRGRLIGLSILLILSTAMLIILYRGPVPANTPSWQGITPSQTTRAEVETLLGAPDRKWRCSWPRNGIHIDLTKRIMRCLPTLGVWNYGYDYPDSPDHPFEFDQIYFKANDTVDYMIEGSYTRPEQFILPLDVLLTRYGKPERVAWSFRDRTNTLLYCQQGLIFHAQPGHDQEVIIMWVIYFTPMSTEQCINKFFNEIITTNPHLGGDVIVSENPWGFSTAEP